MRVVATTGLGRQQGINELEHRVTALGEAGMDRRAEGAEGSIRRIHGRDGATRADLMPAHTVLTQEKL